MYKLIAIDIDGTLLEKSKKVSDKVAKAITYAKNKGVHVVLSTGRPVQGIYAIYDQLNMTTPIITYNGAIVLSNKKGSTIYECSLLPDDCKKIIELGEKLNTTIAIWYKSQLYTNKLNDKAYNYSELSNIPPLLCENKEEIFANGATKILFYDDASVISQYEKDFVNVFSDNVTFHTSRPYFLEFVNKKVSKAIALDKLREYFDIKAEEIIAIGDGFNDLAMIEYAGLGVAMGNAPDGVKENAQYVTDTCEADGVAKAIYKFIK